MPLVANAQKLSDNILSAELEIKKAQLAKVQKTLLESYLDLLHIEDIENIFTADDPDCETKLSKAILPYTKTHNFSNVHIVTLSDDGVEIYLAFSPNKAGYLAFRKCDRCGEYFFFSGGETSKDLSNTILGYDDLTKCNKCSIITEGNLVKRIWAYIVETLRLHAD